MARTRLLLLTLLLCLCHTDHGKGQEAQSPQPGAPGTSIISSGLSFLTVLDIKGKTRRLGLPAPATALVFLQRECVASNRLIPLLNRIAREWKEKGVSVYGIIFEPTTTRAVASGYLTNSGIEFPIIFDASGDLAERLRPTRAPEGFVLDRTGTITYRGLIDNSTVSVGSAREATRHYLEDAIRAAVEGRKPSISETSPSGCLFEAPEATGGLPQTITYTRNITPILYAHCVECHRPGGAAPFSLLTFQDAAKRARMISAVTEDRVMPPWTEVPGSGVKCVNQNMLSEREILILAAWAKAKAPFGDSDDLPEPPHFPDGWADGEPDVVLPMPKPFTVPSEGADVWQAFVLPSLNSPRDEVVLGVDVITSGTALVHHVVVTSDASGIARRLQESNEAQGGYGYTYRPGDWIPGAPNRGFSGFLNGRRYGFGSLLKKGANVVLLMHYIPNGRPAPTLSSVGIYLADKHPHEDLKFMKFGTIGTTNIDIPPGDAAYVRSGSFSLPTGMVVYGSTSHSHKICKEMKLTAQLPSGATVPLLRSKHNYRNEHSFILVEPVHFPAGTRVNWEADYDNSLANPNAADPPQRVVFGPSVTDEMCNFALFMVPDDPHLDVDTHYPDRGEITFSMERR